MTDDKITSIPTSTDELRGSIEEVKRMLPLLMEIRREVAELRYSMFLAYKDAGFNDAQAIELCKKMTI